jgi:hypothetical protein
MSTLAILKVAILAFGKCRPNLDVGGSYRIKITTSPQTKPRLLSSLKINAVWFLISRLAATIMISPYGTYPR